MLLEEHLPTGLVDNHARAKSGKLLIRSDLLSILIMRKVPHDDFIVKFFMIFYAY